VSNDKSPALDRLRRRSGWLSHAEVAGTQRARILSAMLEVVAEDGYIGAAVAPVTLRARVSRSAFYELFDGREDCFLAAFEWGVARMRGVVLDAYRPRRPWRDRVRHALAALLALLDSEPELANACIVEALDAGSLVLERRALILEELIAALGSSAPRTRAVEGPLLLTAEGIVGGAFSVIYGRLLEEGVLTSAAAKLAGDATADVSWSESDDRSSGDRSPRQLMQLHGQLMALIVLPYLGPCAAGEELTRSPPQALAPAETVVASASGSPAR
jgi:AcrR family transcriptional regulator